MLGYSIEEKIEIIHSKCVIEVTEAIEHLGNVL